MKHALAASMLLLLAVVFSTCKKGPDDPFISFKSRTSRLSGDWIMQSGSATYQSSGFNDESFAFDGRGLKMNATGHPLVTYVGTYLLSLHISKDGTFTMRELLAGSTLQAEGTWSFNSGIGEDKKKEDVEFFITHVTNGSTFDEHLFNRYSTNFMYKLQELSSDKVVMHSSGKAYVQGNSTLDFSNDYTFTHL